MLLSLQALYAAAVAVVNVAAIVVINDAVVALMTNQLSTQVGFLKENKKIHF